MKYTIDNHLHDYAHGECVKCGLLRSTIEAEAPKGEKLMCRRCGYGRSCPQIFDKSCDIIPQPQGMEDKPNPNISPEAPAPNTSWENVFSEFYDKNESGGSSRWLVSPSTVKIFIQGQIKTAYEKGCDEEAERQNNQVLEREKIAREEVLSKIGSDYDKRLIEQGREEGYEAGLNLTDNFTDRIKSQAIAKDREELKMEIRRMKLWSKGTVEGTRNDILALLSKT